MEIRMLTLIALLEIASSLPTSAQSPEWINYINQDEINAIDIDARSVWIGTNGGLVKIDRSSDEAVLFHKLNSPLPTNRIICLIIDDFGTARMGTSEGLVSTDGEH